MKPKILIVDDEKQTRELFVQFLEGDEYEVFEAENGQQAFNLAGSESFDLYITDVFMPEMDGIEFLKVLKMFDPDAVVIIITGFDKKEYVEQALEYGAFRFLTKPIKLNDFRMNVEQGLLERRKLFHSSTSEKLHRLKQKLATNVEMREKVYDRFQEFLLLLEKNQPSYVEIGGPGCKDQVWAKFFSYFKPIDFNMVLTQDEINIMILNILTDSQLDQLIEKKSVKANFEFEENNTVYRYRFIIYFDMDELVIGIKPTRRELISLEQMKFNNVVLNRMTFRNNQAGLVIVSGPPGSGKSSLIDALVDFNNRFLPGNIFVVSDSLEYYHEPKKCIIRQQKLYRDVVSVEDALKGCLDYHPNMVVIEDITNPEIFEDALKLVDSGCLVIATMKVKSVTEAIYKLLSFYPRDLHDIIRGRLARTLAVIVCMQLLMSTQKKMIPVKEVLLNNMQILQVLYSGNIEELYAIIQQNRKVGSQTFEQDLLDNIQAGLLTQETAMKAANRPQLLKELLHYANN